MTRRARAGLAGFTLLEIVVAMALTLAVFAITLPFVRAQTRALGSSAGRLDAEQLARYAQRAIDTDLRRAGAISGQPMIVMAGPMAISFNADLLAADTLDPSAADIDASAATTLTASWRLANAAALPLVVRQYPAADYLDATGAMSQYETISYFLRPDTISGHSDIYVLYRRVNARDSVQIMRGLQVPADSAFFSYFRPVGGALTRIAASRLPLYWDSTATDSIRSVGLRATGYFRNRTTGAETFRTVSWITVVPNASTRLTTSCGGAPGAPSSVSTSKQTPNAGYHVRVTWNASADDGAGASDVRQYAVFTRLEADSIWTFLADVPARAASSYRYDHHLPWLLGDVKYGVRAVDCASSSAIATHNSNLSFP